MVLLKVLQNILVHGVHPRQSTMVLMVNFVVLLVLVVIINLFPLRILIITNIMKGGIFYESSETFPSSICQSYSRRYSQIVCDSPIIVRRKDLKTALKRWRRAGSDPNKKPGPFVSVPCGKCISCLKTKRNQMLWRLNRSVNFAKYKSYFLTLTYDEEHLPLFCRDTHSYLDDKETYMPQVTVLRPSVRKRDVQLFFKRLRKYISDHDLVKKDDDGHVLDSERFRYFLTSEYGSKTKRPHYHAVIINFKHDPMLFEHCWKNGNIYVGDSSPASINYVAKYFVFRQDNPFGTVMNFSLSSNGIGSEQLHVLNDFLRNGNLLSLPNGAKIQTPSYVLAKLHLTTFNIRSHEHVSKPDMLLKRLKLVDPGQCKRFIDSYNATNKDLYVNFKKRKTEKL